METMKYYTFFLFLIMGLTVTATIYRPRVVSALGECSEEGDPMAYPQVIDTIALNHRSQEQKTLFYYAAFPERQIKQDLSLEPQVRWQHSGLARCSFAPHFPAPQPVSR
jgi:hypothetical protein